MAEGGGAAPPPEAVRKGISKTLFSVVVVVVAILAFVGGIGLGNVLYAPKSTTSPYLVVGTNIPFPPFEDYDYKNGTYFGFDVNFSAMIAYAAHRTLVIDNYANFATLLTTVGKGGTLDMAASAITETGADGANRSKYLSFSAPYYDANQGVLIQSTNPSGITCPSANCSNPSILDHTGYNIGVQYGTTSQGWAKVLKNATVQVFDDVTVEIAALEAGSLTAVIIDNGPAGALATQSGGKMSVAGVIWTGEQYGFAVALGDPEGLLPIINSVISDAKANGTYDKMLAYWFG